ncbi:spore germination protein GerPC [Paenibacillus sp. OAS669]|uniref:spore germination protein GerPC n=1 Tax=Paenibacillus sp. OAS669 TaxID=2663821 RepID=UPI00178AAF68|nr:spore germination protein GerPC [Paenibacillus sp. OAS669]MBE1446492.1 spore germination protein PC [Paenibacillus sp. OAS669]
MMYNGWQWSQYFQNLHHYVLAHAEKVAELEKTLESVKQELNALKDQKRVHIDRIEYKFDQLKVEKLDGTLNIGITPQSLDEMAVGKNSDQQMDEQSELPAQPTSELQESVQRELEQYLDKDVPQQIDQFEQDSEFQLDPWHRMLILDDLKRQMRERMMYYFQQMEPGATKDQLSSIQDSVLFRTKTDIQKAVDLYFNKLKKKDVSKK